MFEPSQKKKTSEFAPIGIWKLDSDLKVEEVNAAVEEQTGLSRAELLGRAITNLLPFIGKETFSSVYMSKRTVTLKSVRTSFHPDRLLPTYWEISIGPVLSEQRADEVLGYVFSTMEVTEREHLLRQRDDFISALSHNLKTPLLGAERTLDSLLRGALGDLKPEQHEVLSMLRESNLSLLDMVQDLIEVYRYETNSANLCFDFCEVEPLVLACIANFEKQANARNIQLLPLVHPASARRKVYGDRRAIMKMLNHVMDNAMKFSPDGGVIEFSADVVGEQINIKVKDQGPGVNADAEQLFERFWQGDENQYAVNTGLGLYLCNKIAKVHNGKISLDSKLQNGTVVSIGLPVRPVAVSR